MVDHNETLERITAEHILLVTMIGLGVLFYVEPIVQEYPSDARVFPQLMSTIVVIGAVLLLVQDYLPELIRRFVAEDVSLAEDVEEAGAEEVEDITERTSDDEPGDADSIEQKGDPLHVRWGYDVSNTIVMMVFSSVYFALGWAVGFLYVTPLFVLVYTLWFRVDLYKSVLLAVLATVIVYEFIVLLLMPFDEGALIFTGGL